ncbi:HNH endonuclease signature motif containing protein [Enterococcus hulanensis]|uniref:HNH endonuclease signature motif containing protein n=1 Tax=Enterococcus hulanensis TaxID=2559929 RepID=UPI002890F34B|nr:HNH endonuclease signature motif containing protein [Enterococcus hulanensis]MDT2660691.1 HNH endonuclease signature motif containing protein [Enterococcus hulanensis]
MISRDLGLCQECLRRDVIRKGSIVHHKVEARDDLSLFWDVDNLELACVACHNKEHPERSGGEKKKRTRVNTVKFYANNE